MSTKPRFLTRKEVAALLEVSTDVVRRNEKRLGLDECRRDINTRPRYDREQAEKALKQAGVV